MSEIVNECGYDTAAPSVTPINIAPAPEVSQQAALLMPKVVPTVSPSNINVFLKDTDIPVQSSDGDTIEFILNFAVSNFDEATGASRQFIVPKRISVSKRRLFADGENAINTMPATVVEEVSVEHKKSDAQRMRELAGIPHHKNHV